MKEMREAAISRQTGETDVRLHLSLEGTGRYEVQSGVGFLDHMLALFARHGGFDLEPYPALRDWLARVRRVPGFVAMPAPAPEHAARLAATD